MKHRVIEQDMTNNRASNNYLGERGRKYFEQQNALGILSAKYNEFLFTPYVSNGDDILDFGCGGGNLLSILDARRKVGIEINPVAREYAKINGITVLGTLEELKGERFNRVITSHALEHVPNPHFTLTRLRKVITDDGLLIWLSPMDDWRNSNQRHWRPNNFDMHLYTWTPLTIGNLLKVAGFEPKSIRVFSHAFPPRISNQLWKMSPQLFHIAAYAWAIISKRRQILAVAGVGLTD